MERRRRSERKPSTRRLKPPPKASSPSPHIEELISYDGNISIRRVHPIASAAVASDKHNMLAALVRRANESFLEFLARLDQAIGRALSYAACLQRAPDHFEIFATRGITLCRWS